MSPSLTSRASTSSTRAQKVVTRATSRRSSAPETTPDASTIHLKDLTPDDENARTHTAKNIGMIADSLRAVGAGRSIVIDEDDRVLAGNGLCEAAAEAGITRVQVVEADGNTIIAVRRRNLTPEQKRKLALYDNRTAELAEWNVEMLRDFAAAGFDLQPFEFDASLLGEKPTPDGFQKVDENVSIDHTCPKCGYRWSGKTHTDD